MNNYEDTKVVPVCEDTVYVNVFSISQSLDNSWYEVLCEKLNNTLTLLSNDYTWHRDELKFYYPLTEDINSPKHLKSCTCYGDNVEDEWFIVYLIIELSKQYSGLIFQVIDSDGDFLLIEAANHLPKWANPDTTENRVFIHNEAIHVIPPALVDLKKKLKICDALQLLAQSPEKTKASMDIQEAILSHVRAYPNKIKDNVHNEIVNLPVHIAALLKMKPSLISDIVNTYCAHDIIDVKTCTNLNYTDIVTVSIKFTKCLYAMLMHSKLIKSTGVKVTENNKKSLMGLKLTCGYNMIMNRLPDDIFSTKEYIRYISNLKENGYFNDNMEHSMEYNKLIDKANQYYLERECPINSYVANNISDLIATDEFLRLKTNLKNYNNTQELVSDSDDWLNIQPHELEDLLKTRFNEHISSDVKDDSITPQTITSKLTDFLNDKSDFEGIEPRNVDEEDTFVQFEPDNFVLCLEKMMNLVCEENNSDSASNSDSDYMEDDTDNEIDKELATKLTSREDCKDPTKKVQFYLSQSIKEEGLSGPSSNLLKTIGISKSDILDSDDE